MQSAVVRCSFASASPVIIIVQVTKDELRTAMTFLKDQLGEDELRLLLERMDAFDDNTKLDVSQLMSLAESKSSS